MRILSDINKSVTQEVNAASTFCLLARCLKQVHSIKIILWPIKNVLQKSKKTKK